MPIYAYKCSACGHGADVMQKLSDAPLTVCTACGQATFSKQITAAGFQLKGSGWYATDFKTSGKPSSKPAEGAKADSGDGGSKAPESKPAEPSKPAESSKPAASSGDA